MAYGLLSTGYNGKPFQVCRDEVSALVRAKRGTSADVSDGSLLGQIIAINAERESQLWDLGAAIVSAYDPDAAIDAAQDAIAALSGTFRAAARASSTTLTLTGTPTTNVAASSQVAALSNGNLFKTKLAATIATLPAWAGATSYVLGARVTNAGNAYQCTVAGSSTGAAPTGTATAIPDGVSALVWTYLGAGTGAVDVGGLSVTLDAIVALARDLSVIKTPVGGWQGVINLTDAVPGALQQTNESLRITREAELSQSGSGTPDAIRAAILAITGVTACFVFHNDTDVIDGNGQNPHTVQAVVTGGADAAIASVLFANVGAGLLTFGTTSVVVLDSQGTAQTYKFTRPTALPIYVDITLTYNPALPTKGGYPTLGDAAVQAALSAFGAAIQVVGKDAVASSIGAAAFPVYVNGVLALGVQGVLDVTSTKISTAPGPTLSTTITVTPFQQAVLDTSRITVHSSPGTV